mmetsp:Transcript_14577/g.19732  ORF Transcript_14577/g.19732 Transcript_14577/m.19732 type:complete len:121 (+) Transcript_14577:224-586(+)
MRKRDSKLLSKHQHELLYASKKHHEESENTIYDHEQSQASQETLLNNGFTGAKPTLRQARPPLLRPAFAPKSSPIKSLVSQDGSPRELHSLSLAQLNSVASMQETLQQTLRRQSSFGGFC